MSKATLARALADEFNSTFARARRFVDEVGESQARTVLGRSGQPQGGLRPLPQLGDDAGGRLSNISTGALVGAGTAATAGGGYLYLQKQEADKAQAKAKTAEQYDESLQGILESDLPPEVMEDLASSTAAATGNDPSGGGNGILDAIPGIPSLGINEGLQTVLFIVVVIGLLYVSTSDEGPNINVPTSGGE